MGAASTRNFYPEAVAPDQKTNAGMGVAAGAEPGGVGRLAGPSAFWMLWASQIVSLLGTDMTRFALRLWAFREADEMSDFAWLTFFAEVHLYISLCGNVSCDPGPTAACSL